MKHISLTLLATAVWLSGAPSADACGGFFCSNVPVAQSGEVIVYTLKDDGTIVMTVQVDFQGMDDDFSWILPVIAPPTDINTGTPAFFTALQQAAAPVFQVNDQQEGVCRPYPTCVFPGGATSSGGGCGFSSGVGATASPRAAFDAFVADASTSDTRAPDADTVTVFSESRVGPYDTVVLGAASAATVVQWLSDNEYIVPDGSAELLEPYAASGQVFLALRLSANAPTGTVRPIELTIPTSEACLPIRLTAIATVQNMPIDTYFLGRNGVMPANYATAVPSLEEASYWFGGRRWETAAGEAADALGGQAFAVGYAGPTPSISVTLLSIDDLATETDPSRFVSELQARGYPPSTLFLELLTLHIEPPAGWLPQDYFNCLANQFGGCPAPASFDPQALVDALDVEIRQPRERAQAQINAHPYLTRLYTDMSAEEMTVDPIFVEDARVPDTSNVFEATLVTECSADYYSGDAPQRLDYEDMSFPLRSGSRADDDVHCANRGAVTSDSEEGRRRLAESGDSGCGCIASNRGGGLPGAVLITMGAMLIWRYQRRRWRRR